MFLNVFFLDLILSEGFAEVEADFLLFRLGNYTITFSLGIPTFN